jgi:lipase chaperone LimK
LTGAEGRLYSLPPLRHSAMSTATSRETIVDNEGEGLATRLAAMERAYAEVVERLRRYESERAEIRLRLSRLLALIEQV